MRGKAHSPHLLRVAKANNGRESDTVRVDSVERENTCTWAKGIRMARTITRDELKAKIDRGDNFILVETLPTPYYRHTHLPGAVNLPPDQVTELAPTMLLDKAAEIIVYCANPT